MSPFTQIRLLHLQCLTREQVSAHAGNPHDGLPRDVPGTVAEECHFFAGANLHVLVFVPSLTRRSEGATRPDVSNCPFGESPLMPLLGVGGCRAMALRPTHVQIRAARKLGTPPDAGKRDETLEWHKLERWHTSQSCLTKTGSLSRTNVASSNRRLFWQSAKRKEEMKRQFKVVGVLVAVVAMAAVMASGAQAEFTASAYPAEIEAGSTADVFDAFGSTVKCTSNTFTGSISGPAASLTVTPSYNKCTAFGLPATVNFTSCDYNFTTPTSPAPSPATGIVHIECKNAGDHIDVTIFSSSTHSEVLCHLYVGPQTAEYTISRGTTSGGNKDVNLSGTVSPLVATQERTSILCPSGTETKEAKYTIQSGGITVTRKGGGDVTYD